MFYASVNWRENSLCICRMFLHYKIGRGWGEGGGRNSLSMLSGGFTSFKNENIRRNPRQ